MGSSRSGTGSSRSSAGSSRSSVGSSRSGAGSSRSSAGSSRSSVGSSRGSMGNKNAKAEYYALKLGLHLDIVHVNLLTKVQDNPLRNGCDIAVCVQGILD